MISAVSHWRVSIEHSVTRGHRGNRTRQLCHRGGRARSYSLSAHSADELSQGDAGEVLSDGLLGAIGYAAHDTLHVAAHAALL
jgi:hypothetical protein